ncbi:cytochrome P450 [Hypoxylon sp. FL1857]|nr:cytochrome P450 [Hypoxylon sp. FL1857]
MTTSLNLSEAWLIDLPFREGSYASNWASQNLALSVTIISVLLASLYWAALPKPLAGIPYTRKSRWQLFGDAFDFVNYSKETGEGFRWFATKAAELQSPIFQVFLAPLSKPIVVVTDIQEIIDMSTRRAREFDRGGFLTGWVGILFPEGTISMPSHDKFKDQRNIWSSTMTSQFLNSVSAKTIHKHTVSLVNLWSTKVQLANGRPFEVSDDLKQVTFDMVRAPLFPLFTACTLIRSQIWSASTGDDLGLITRRIKAAAATSNAVNDESRDKAVKFQGPTDLPEIVDACEVLVEHLKNMRGSVWLAATKLWVWMTPSWKKAWNIKEEVMIKLVEESSSKFGEAQCAMDEVIKRSNLLGSKGRKSSSHREMVDETFSYIVGGHETTQDTTKWSMKYLTANQDKQSKLREALLEIWPNANAHNLPSYQEIIASEHPYVEASIQELIRIALTAPSWTRRTTQDVIVLGHRIPAGIDVFGAPSVQSIEDMDDFVIDPTIRSATSKQREAGKWDRATKGLYQPERWLDENGKYDAYAGPMLPFGAGPRGCFGQRLARMELRMMIIMLVLSFEFNPIPEEYSSFRPEEVINRGPHITYIRPVLRA